MTKYWWLWLIFGALAIAVGIFALLNPIPATLAAEQLAAIGFLIAGGVWFFSTFSAEGWKAKVWSLLVGAAMTWLGFTLLTNPMAGVLSLTIAVAITLLILGAFKIVMAIQSREESYYWVVLISGVLSILLGIMVLFNFPFSAVAVLGILLGAELIADGISMIALSFWAKNEGNPEAAA